MLAGRAVDDLPSAEEIAEQLNRMVASEVFVKSPQLIAFLRYVVQAGLTRRADRVTAFSIATDALGRDPKTFDPQSDPTVRVEATRLRRAIQRYYAGPGANDPIVIDISVGSYVPTFRWPIAEAEPKRRDAIEFIKNEARRQPMVASVAGLVVAGMIVLAVVTVGDLAYRWSWPPAARDSRPVVDSSFSEEMPTLVVEPLTADRIPASANISPKTLAVKLQGAFARFDAITVIQGAHNDKRIDYRVDGLLEYHGDVATSVSVRLFNVADGKFEWAQTFERPQLEKYGFNAEMVCPEIVIT